MKYVADGPTPAPRLATLTAYAPTDAPTKIDLWLNGNEGLHPPDDLAAEVARLGPDVFRRYPSKIALEAQIGARFGVSAERVLVTAGADDALYRACMAVLGESRELILPVPTFEMLARYAQLAGGRVIEVDWSSGEYPIDAVCAAITPATAMIAVVSPNNPSGAVATGAHLQRLAQCAPHALLVVDLAYVEFADEDPTSTALELPNALVTRTLSKAWGLAGLRVGFALAPPEIIGWLRVTGNPYPVAGPSLALAQTWLEAGASAMGAFVEIVRAERTQLHDCLLKLGAQPQPSQANFVLARFTDACGAWRGLAERGIAVRAFADRPGQRDCLRITCPGDPRAFQRLIGALEAVMCGDATGSRASQGSM